MNVSCTRCLVYFENENHLHCAVDGDRKRSSNDNDDRDVVELAYLSIYVYTSFQGFPILMSLWTRIVGRKDIQRIHFDCARTKRYGTLEFPLNYVWISTGEIQNKPFMGF